MTNRREELLQTSGREAVDWREAQAGAGSLLSLVTMTPGPPPPRLAAILLLIRTQWAAPGAGPSGRCGAAAAGLSRLRCLPGGRAETWRPGGPRSRGEPWAPAAQVGPVSDRSRAKRPARHPRLGWRRARGCNRRA